MNVMCTSSRSKLIELISNVFGLSLAFRHFTPQAGLFFVEKKKETENFRIERREELVKFTLSEYVKLLLESW